MKIKSSPLLFLLLLSPLVVYFPLIGSIAVNPDAYLTFPELMEVKNPIDYLRNLINFNVIDFQPIRDLSFFLDLLFFRLTGITSFATTNIFLWSLSGYLLLRILKRIVPDDNSAAPYLWVIFFLCFPLFSQIVPWGMGRKHILAFVLILASTLSYLDWLEGKSKWIKAYLFYVASCLSHPLVVLWPIWAFIHPKFNCIKMPSDSRKVHIALALTALSILLTNYAYYSVGNAVVAENFWKIKPDYLNFPRHLTTLAFAFRQMVFPFNLSFLYHPTWQNSWPGLIVISLIGLLMYQGRKNWKQFSWPLFGFITIPITFTLPNFFDQYCLLPFTGIFIMLFQKFHEPTRWKKTALILLTLGLAPVTFMNARIWQSEERFAERNFRNLPTCKHARDFARKRYENNSKAPSDLLSYLEGNNCLITNSAFPPGENRAVIYLKSMMLFYETEIYSRETRISELQTMAKFHYFPELVLAAVYAGKDDPEKVEATARIVLSKIGSSKLSPEVILKDVLRPYCEQRKLQACLQVTDFKTSPDLPY